MILQGRTLTLTADSDIRVESHDGAPALVLDGFAVYAPDAAVVSTLLIAVCKLLNRHSAADLMSAGEPT